MNPVRIHVYGKHPEILETVLRLINKQEGWEGKGSTDLAAFLQLLQEHAADLILLGGGISPSDEQHIRQYAAENLPNLQVIQHYGGGSGLLYNEVTSALSHQDTLS
ncbi:MAG: hypothetical protein AAGI38_16875 [Bacteroidota bacterium]